MLTRLVCKHGLTSASAAQQALRARYTRMDRDTLRSVRRSALEEAVRDGRSIAERLADSRGTSIEDPFREIARIFHHFGLGSPRGRIARWVVAEAVKARTLWGLQRFDIVQAFTLVAQSLDHAVRRRFEDAMRTCPLHGFGKARGSTRPTTRQESSAAADSRAV